MNAKVTPTNTVKASFPVRRMDFEFNQVPEYWLKGSAGLTHFMTALSALFPDGEQFFVDSVRAVRYHPLLKDNLAMQKEISAFIGQEAMHSKEHVGFNQSAAAYGHDVKALERTAATVIHTSRKLAGKLLKFVGVSQEVIDLTATTALEHFTATIAAELLRNTEIQSLMQDETMYRLWMWHAVEENEHKAVVYDVYQAIHGDGAKSYALRTSVMVGAMVILFFTQAYGTFRLLKNDNAFSVANFKDIYKYGYSPSHGVFTRMVPELLDYFRPSFHPNDHDTVKLLADWKKKLGFTSH